MKLVHEALLQQRKTWRRLVDEIPKSGIHQALPPIFPSRIILFGVGSSHHAARLTALTLLRHLPPKFGKAAIPIVGCSSHEVGMKVIPTRNDWVFAFSHQGKTEITRRALDLCHQAGAFTVMVSARGADIPRNVNLHLPTSNLEKCEPHTVGLTSAICAVTLLLFDSAASEAWIRLSRSREPNFEILKSSDLVPPTLLLGEWEGEWIAREISLKLTEIAGLRVPVYGSEEFFHGPRELSEKMGTLDQIWYVATSKDGRQNQIRSNLCFRVNTNLLLSWVSALVELQWQTLAFSKKP